MPYIETWWCRLLNGEFRRDYWEQVHARRKVLALYVVHHGTAGLNTRGWPSLTDFCFNVPEYQGLVKQHPNNFLVYWRYGELLQIPSGGGIDVPWDDENLEYDVITLATPLCVRNWQTSIGLQCLSASDPGLLPPPKDRNVEFLCAPTTWFRCQVLNCPQPLLRILDVCEHKCMYQVPDFPAKRKGRGRSNNKKYPEHWPKGPERQSIITIATQYGCAWGDYAQKPPVLDAFAGKVALFLLDMYRATKAKLPRFVHSVALPCVGYKVDNRGNYSFEDAVRHCDLNCTF